MFGDDNLNQYIVFKFDFTYHSSLDEDAFQCRSEGQQSRSQAMFTLIFVNERIDFILTDVSLITQKRSLLILSTEAKSQFRNLNRSIPMIAQV